MQKRKTLSFKLVIRASDIRVRKPGAQPTRKFVNKRKYNRKGSKSFERDLDPFSFNERHIKRSYS